jgi:hypothetical protein
MTIALAVLVLGALLVGQGIATTLVIRAIHRDTRTTLTKMDETLHQIAGTQERIAHLLQRRPPA